jgi:hypothetical protein
MAQEDSTSSPVPDAFLIAVGSLTLNWAAIESALDFTITVIYNVFPYPNMREEAPQNLGRKLEFIKLALASNRLTSIRAPSRQLMGDLKARKDDRHNVVHGAILDAPGDAIRSLRVRYVKGGHTVAMHVVTTAEVESYSDVALRLAERTTAFSAALYNIARPEKMIDHPLGEFAV